MLSFSDVQKKCVERGTDIAGHLIRLYQLTAQFLSAKTVVELGVATGQSTHALLAAVNDTGGHLYSVDKEDKYGLREKWKNEVNWTFIVGNDLEVVKKWNKQIDHLFIDTKHTFEHTLAELRTWGSWLKPQGIITLHDTDWPQGKVREAISEYLKEKENYEFINFEGSHGLGLLKPRCCMHA